MIPPILILSVFCYIGILINDVDSYNVDEVHVDSSCVDGVHVDSYCVDGVHYFILVWIHTCTIFLIYRLKTCFSFESDFSNYVFKNWPILQPIKITWYRLYILLNKQNILNMCNVFINFHRVQNKKFDFCMKFWWFLSFSINHFCIVLILCIVKYDFESRYNCIKVNVQY